MSDSILLSVWSTHTVATYIYSVLLYVYCDHESNVLSKWQNPKHIMTFWGNCDTWSCCYLSKLGADRKQGEKDDVDIYGMCCNHSATKLLPNTVFLMKLFYLVNDHYHVFFLLSSNPMKRSKSNSVSTLSVFPMSMAVNPKPHWLLLMT